MSKKSEITIVEKCRRMGRYMAARYLRNQGVPFEAAYHIIFGQPPKEVKVSPPTTMSQAQIDRAGVLDAVILHVCAVAAVGIAVAMGLG